MTEPSYIAIKLSAPQAASSFADEVAACYARLKQNPFMYEQCHESTIRREFGSLLEIKDNYPKYVLYKEGSFKGNYEGIPAVKVEDWLLS